MSSSTREMDSDEKGWCLFRTGTFEHPVLIPLDRNEVVIGRISNKYLKKSPFVSRKHVVFFKCGDDWHVEDLGSTNGTYVNEVKINSNYIYPVRESDVVGLGMASATTEEHFSFKLCKHSDIEGRGEEKEPEKRQSGDILDSTLVSVENCDFLSSESQLSTAKHPQSTQHNHMDHPKLLKSSLTKLEPISMILRSRSTTVHKDREFRRESHTNNSNILDLERVQTTSTAGKHCDDSNIQHFHNDENLHSKLMLATTESCSTITRVSEERHKLSRRDFMEASSSKSATEHLKMELCENPDKRTSSLKNSVHLSDCSMNNTNYAGKYKKSTVKSSMKTRKRTRDSSKLIEIGEPVEKIVCSDLYNVTMQNKTNIVDPADKDRTELNVGKKKRRNNIITVPDDGTSVVKSNEIKEDVVILSDNENDDDCFVVDNQLSKPTSSSRRTLRQSMLCEVENNTYSDLSISKKAQINPSAGNVIEIDESSNDTHISETVDDCVALEICKPEFNIDEETLLSRISWPDLLTE